MSQPSKHVSGYDEGTRKIGNSETLLRIKSEWSKAHNLLSSSLRRGAQNIKAVLIGPDDDIQETAVSSATDSRASMPPRPPPKPKSLTPQNDTSGLRRDMSAKDATTRLSSTGHQAIREHKNERDGVNTPPPLPPLKPTKSAGVIRISLEVPPQKPLKPTKSEDVMNVPEVSDDKPSIPTKSNRAIDGPPKPTKPTGVSFNLASHQPGATNLSPRSSLGVSNPQSANVDTGAIDTSRVSSFKSSSSRDEYQQRRNDQRLQDFYRDAGARHSSRARHESFLTGVKSQAQAFVSGMLPSQGPPVAKPSPCTEVVASAGVPKRSQRGESSFAIWQIDRARRAMRDGIHWDGDQKKPYFCYLVIALTFIILFAEIAKNGFQIENFSDNATLGPSKETLLAMGAKRADLILQGDFHRLLGAWWLHGGLLHWLINMVALRNLGFSMEREFGTPKIAIIYCWSGISGVLSSSVFLPNVVGVGASGAIFGLFGAAWADVIQNYGLYKTRKEAKKMIKNLAVGTIINILLGLIPIIDQFAHMGGLFTGLFLGLYLLIQTRYTRYGVEKEFRTRHNLLRSFGLAFAIVGPMTMLIVLYTQTDPKAKFCHWCENVNCAPINAFWFCDASGCSDDSTSVYGSQFPNGTVVIQCPSFVGKNVSSQFIGQAEALDVIKICRAKCFE